MLINDLAFFQISGEFDNNMEVNQLLNILPYEVEEGQEALFNNYFISQIEEKGVGRLVKHFALHNDIKLIDKCIQEIIKWMSQPLNDEKVECLREIIGILSAQRRKEIMEKSRVWEHFQRLKTINI